MTDLELQRAVVEALDRNRIVRPDEISVEVVDGDVALRGTVGSVLQQWEAASAASSVPGIRSLDNRLSVRWMGVGGRADADTEAAVLDVSRPGAYRVEARVRGRLWLLSNPIHLR